MCTPTATDAPAVQSPGDLLPSRQLRYKYIKQTTEIVGCCHYCGRLERMTRDHRQPKAVRHREDFVPNPEQTAWVWACLACNRRKKDSTYEAFLAWLNTPVGTTFLTLRHQLRPPGTRQRGCICPLDGAHRHFCAERKACGILRERVLVVDDSRSWQRFWKSVLEGGTHTYEGAAAI